MCRVPGFRFAPPGRLAWLPLAAMLLLLALVAEHSALDYWVLDRFYDPALNGFPARRAWWAQHLLHDGQARLILLIALAALGVWGASFFAVRLRGLRRAALYLLACIALSTGTVGALKHYSPRACPWDLQVYGGDRVAVQASAPEVAAAEPGRCFPGGHSSGAFSLLALAVLLRRRGSRWATPALGGVLLLGLGYALTQWLRGAHFPSHDLWSALIGWTAAHLLAPMLGPALRRAAVEKAKAKAVAVPETAATLVLALAGGLLALAPTEGRAAENSPFVREITFRGNDTTQPQIMLREMALKVGDAADPAAIERDRQAIQDLGLFRAVEVEQQPLADGVRLVFVVREKWYLLPYPRVSANSDGQDALGAELRWNNVGGLNHSLRALVSSADRREDGRGRQLGYLASYQAPFLFDSPYTLNLKVSHTSTPITPPDTPAYDETIDEAQILLGRKLGAAGAASQGWSAAGGLLWRNRDHDGADTAGLWGNSYAAVAQFGYRDEHDHVYSEEGTVFTVRYEIADRHLLSDYSYSRMTAGFKRSIALGDTPHQNLEFAAAIGTANGGRSETPPFALGGTQGLRGYARNSFRGNAYSLASASYLRPIGWDWLRLVATVEAGNVYEEADAMDANIRWSFGLGLRIRVPRLVGVEIEAGIALPLSNDSARFYGYRSGF